MLLMLAGAPPVSNKSSSQPRPKTIPLGTMKNWIDTVLTTRIASRRTRCVVGARSRRAYAIIGAAGSARSSPVRLVISWKSTQKVRDRITLLYTNTYRHNNREGGVITLCYWKQRTVWENTCFRYRKILCVWFELVWTIFYWYMCVHLGVHTVYEYLAPSFNCVMKIYAWGTFPRTPLWMVWLNVAKKNTENHG